MKMTQQQKHNLLEFLKRTDIKGFEAETFINLLLAINNSEIEEK